MAGTNQAIDSTFISELTILPDITIQELLTRNAPMAWRQSKQEVIFSQPIDWYRKEEPTMEAPSTLSAVVLPDPKTCLYIADAFNQALEAGCRSIVHPYHRNERLPLSLARTFKLGHELLRQRTTWERRRDWVRNAALDEHWDAGVVEKANITLLQCPWMSLLPGIRESATNGFGILLSNQWLTSTALDCMLEVVRLDHQTSTLFDPKVRIAHPTIGQSIASGHQTPTSTYYGKHLKDGTIEQLLFPMNIGGCHWIAVKIHVPDYVLLIGDSYPSFSLPYIKRTVDAIKSWLFRWLPETEETSGRWSVSLTGLPIGLQKDSTSCGVAAVNVIHRLTSNDAPMWSSENPQRWRTYYFVRCVEVGLQSPDAVSPIALRILPHAQTKIGRAHV